MSFLPSDAKERKKIPMFTGLLAYFPDALAAVAHCSWVGNEQHNPGEPLHWAREKSTDQEDTAIRHLLDRDAFDDDGVRHRAKAAWRVLAQLQLEIEKSGIVYRESASDELRAALEIDDSGRVALDCGDCGEPVEADSVEELPAAFEEHLDECGTDDS